MADDLRACDPVEHPVLGLRPSELEYLRQVERLANAVCDVAADEDWYLADGVLPLQEAINTLAKTLRHLHSAGDGCLDDERP